MSNVADNFTFGSVLRGQPFEAWLDIWEDNSQTVPYDLEAASPAPTVVVGGIVLTVGAGIVLSVGGDGTGTVKNRAELSLTPDQTSLFTEPSVHWRLVVPEGIPVRGELLFDNP